MFSDVSGNMCVSLGGGGIGPVLQYAHMQSGGLLGGAQAGTTKGADTSFPFYLNLRCEPSPLVWLNSVPKGTRDNAWCLLMHTKASVSLSLALSLNHPQVSPSGTSKVPSACTSYRSHRVPGPAPRAGHLGHVVPAWKVRKCQLTWEPAGSRAMTLGGGLAAPCPASRLRRVHRGVGYRLPGRRGRRGRGAGAYTRPLFG